MLQSTNGCQKSSSMNNQSAAHMVPKYNFSADQKEKIKAAIKNIAETFQQVAGNPTNEQNKAAISQYWIISLTL